MATQHPDNTSPAYWNGKAFISAADEVEEAYICWSELGVHEYMWDWEGKFVDEAVIDRLFRAHDDYFREHQLGRDIFLTYRIPNIWQESDYRLMRAFMNIISVAEFARVFGYSHQAVFEIILPMTESSDQMMYLKRKFKKLTEIFPELIEAAPDHIPCEIEIIPIFETVGSMVKSADVLEEYVKALSEFSGAKPSYVRAFIARSDPALNAGLIPSVLSAKAAISEYKRFESEHEIPVYPLLGAGSLPFRGNLSPDRVHEFMSEYKGLSTVTLQSSFRYDHGLPLVKAGIAELNDFLPKYMDEYMRFNTGDIEKVLKINSLAVPFYQKTIEAIAEWINKIAHSVPARRERMLHIGLFGYSRGVGSVKLPRAIPFTAALYSLGIPPELIGTGRALKKMKEEGLSDFAEEHYCNLKKDLAFAYGFFNKENFFDLCKTAPEFRQIADDIEYIEDYLKITDFEYSVDHILHRNEVSSLYRLLKDGKQFDKHLLNAAEVRQSLG